MRGEKNNNRINLTMLLFYKSTLKVWCTRKTAPALFIRLYAICDFECWRYIVNQNKCSWQVYELFLWTESNFLCFFSLLQWLSRPLLSHPLHYIMKENHVHCLFSVSNKVAHLHSNNNKWWGSTIVGCCCCHYVSTVIPWKKRNNGKTSKFNEVIWRRER